MIHFELYLTSEKVGGYKRLFWLREDVTCTFITNKKLETKRHVEVVEVGTKEQFFPTSKTSGTSSHISMKQR